VSELKQVPQILDIPKVYYPVLEGLNDYRYFLCEGGRNSLKSHTVARLILYLAEQSKYRIVCGREIQKSIEDSVHALFSDLITEHNLYFDVGKATIKHKETGSTIRFIGLREQGVANVKSLEGCDIFWGEEAQTFSKATVDILLPTIRKPNSKLFFTMNRFIRKDPIFVNLANRKDCLHIHANFDDIEPRFIAPNVIVEAEQSKSKNEKDYQHIWMGNPLETTEDYLFNFAKLDKLDKTEAFGELYMPQSVMSVDFSGNGGDLCVAKHLVRRSNVHWEDANEIVWSDPDTDVSVGKTIALYGEWKPDVLIVDADGLGYPMFVTISKTIPGVIGFKGAGESRVANAGNQRADGWLCVKEFVDQEWFMCKSQYTINNFESIKQVHHASGKIYIQSKKDIRKDTGESPDRGDADMMGLYAVKYYIGKQVLKSIEKITRVNKPKRR